jgi:hypothetical protein
MLPISRRLGICAASDRIALLASLGKGCDVIVH